MKRLLHLSDLHFGRSQLRAEESIQRFLGEQGKSLDLVVVTGDWTQRGRHAQYRQASAFLQKLPTKVLSVPGNHDVPLFDLWTRFTNPFGRYERYIESFSVNSHRDEAMAVKGISTVDPWQVADGILREGERRAAEEFFRASRPALNILASHHPLEDLRVPAGQAPAWVSGANVVLSGHAHRQRALMVEGPGGERYLSVVSGSSVSDRLRGEENSFHLLEIERGSVLVRTFFLGEEGFRESPQGAQALSFS